MPNLDHGSRDVERIIEQAFRDCKHLDTPARMIRAVEDAKAVGIPEGVAFTIAWRLPFTSERNDQYELRRHVSFCK